jgi:hypothetical protein
MSKSGWVGESQRHRLASKGIKTCNKSIKIKHSHEEYYGNGLSATVTETRDLTPKEAKKMWLDTSEELSTREIKEIYTILYGKNPDNLSEEEIIDSINNKIKKGD